MPATLQAGDNTTIDEQLEDIRAKERKRLEVLVEDIELKEPGAYSPVSCRRNWGSTYCNFMVNAGVMWRDDRMVRAARYYKAALEKRPSSSSAMAGLGAALAVIGHCDLALPFLERGAHVEHETFALYRLVDCYQDGWYEDGRSERLARITFAARHNVWAVQELLTHYVRRGDWATARSFVEKIVAAEKAGDPEAFGPGTHWLARLGQRDKAIELAKKGIETWDGDEETQNVPRWAARELINFHVREPQVAKSFRPLLEDKNLETPLHYLDVIDSANTDGWKAALELSRAWRKTSSPPEDSSVRRSVSRVLDAIDAYLVGICVRQSLRTGEVERLRDCEEVQPGASHKPYIFVSNDIPQLERLTSDAARGRNWALARRLDREVRFRQRRCESVDSVLRSSVTIGEGASQAFAGSLLSAYWDVRCGTDKVDIGLNYESDVPRVAELAEAFHLAARHFAYGNPRQAHAATSIVQPGDPATLWAARMWTAAYAGNMEDFLEAKKHAMNDRSWRYTDALSQVLLHISRKEWAVAERTFELWLKADYQPPTWSEDLYLVSTLINLSLETRPSLARSMYDKLMIGSGPIQSYLRRKLDDTGTTLAAAEVGP